METNIKQKSIFFGCWTLSSCEVTSTPLELPQLQTKRSWFSSFLVSTNRQGQLPQPNHPFSLSVDSCPQGLFNWPFLQCNWCCTKLMYDFLTWLKWKELYKALQPLTFTFGAGPSPFVPLPSLRLVNKHPFQSPLHILFGSPNVHICQSYRGNEQSNEKLLQKNKLIICISGDFRFISHPHLFFVIQPDSICQIVVFQVGIKYT